MLKTPELRYVSYKSGRLAYREAGEGPVLFFLHGMNGSSRSWLYIFEALAPSFRIIAWDAPSFGASDTYGDRIEDYVRAARALLQAVEINEAIVIGHSMGGVIAARFATDPGFLTKGRVLSFLVISSLSEASITIQAPLPPLIEYSSLINSSLYSWIAILASSSRCLLISSLSISSFLFAITKNFMIDLLNLLICINNNV